jgi:flagellum-specific ATP synthase
MYPGVADIVSLVRGQVQQAPTFSRYGRVASISGLIVESEGPNVGLGELCVLRSQRNDFEVLAEVVGFRSEKILLMALGDVGGLHVGCETVAMDSLVLSCLKPGR